MDAPIRNKIPGRVCVFLKTNCLLKISHFLPDKLQKHIKKQTLYLYELKPIQVL